MRRFFLPVSLALIAVYALMAVAAYRAVELEIEHDTQAQDARRLQTEAKIGEELQREFAHFVAAENDRPFYHYQFFYIPEDVTGRGQSVLRSPLGNPSLYTYAQTYFQVNRKGEVSTPMYNTEIPEANTELGEETTAVAAEQIFLEEEVLPLIIAKVLVTDENDYALIPLAALQEMQEMAEKEKETLLLLPPDTGPKALRSRVEVQQTENIEFNNISNQLFQQQNIARPPRTISYRLITERPTREEIAAVKYSPFYLLSGTDTVASFFVRRVEMPNHAYIQGFLLDREYVYRRLSEIASSFIGEEYRFVSEGDRLISLPFGLISFSLVPSGSTAPQRLAEQHREKRRQFNYLIGASGFAVLLALLFFYLTIRREAELSRKKDDFISAVSHELRTPLTGILMYAEMLDENWVADADRRRKYLGHILREGKRLSRLVENVLDFSRVVRHNKKYDMAVNDLAEVAAEVAVTLAPRMEREGFVFNRQVAVPPFQFDRDAITQVLFNLLSNAMKFSGDRKEIDLTARYFDQEVIIEVADRGRGIPEKERQRIFDPFYRVEQEMTRTTPGTGIGLSLVWQFIMAHQGNITVQSRPDGGTIFRIALPLKTPPVDE